MNRFILASLCIVLSVGPAFAQLNTSTTIQNAQRKIQGAQDQTQESVTQAQATQAQAFGTVVNVDGRLIQVDQSIIIEGKPMTVRNKFYTWEHTQMADGFHPAARMHVRILFQTGADGRRMINQIGP